MVYDEWVSAIGQGVFTAIMGALVIVGICAACYFIGKHVGSFIGGKIRAKLKSRKIGKSDNDHGSSDKSEKDN